MLVPSSKEWCLIIVDNKLPSLKIDNMRKLLVLAVALFAIGFANNVSASGFPGKEYSYVKVFLMNIEKTTAKPDLNILSLDRYCKSKIGNGTLLDEDQLESLQDLLTQNMLSLHVGLSKCFIPRHGIVYYNDKHEPVAAMSLCFECEKVRFYPNIYKDVKGPVQSTKVVIKQLKAFHKILDEAEVPVYDDKTLYAQHLGDDDYTMNGIVTITNDTYEDRLFKEQITKGVFKSRIKLNNRNTRILETKRSKTAAGGTTYNYLEMTYRASKFQLIMGEDEWMLASGHLLDEGLKFDNDVMIGMSQDEFMTTLGIYDGPANPERIIVQHSAGDYKYEFIFKFRTLIKIEFTTKQ